MIEYHVREGKIIVEIPAANEGKFRFKTRKDNLSFGDTFSTRTKVFDPTVYLEWQIGYDATVVDVRGGKKITKLVQQSFKGANDRLKYPYELSELIFEAVNAGLISTKEIEALLEEIKSYSQFLDDKKIAVERHSEIIINGVSFEETSIKLPTYFMIETPDSSQIEVSIQKQQYASGVQPMVYFCIPLSSFENGNDLLGRSSLTADKLRYVISNKNVEVLLKIMKVFAMSSKRHNQDVINIFNLILMLTATK